MQPSVKQNFQFTKEGYQSLRGELATLISRRPQVLTNLVNAREQGDLSENAGYHAAKEELGKIDSRSKEIKYLLRIGKVVENADAQVVNFGSKVTLEINGKILQFQIVEELEADPKKGKISTNSPIGSALMSKKTGEEISIDTQEGKIIYKIKEIS